MKKKITFLIVLCVLSCCLLFGLFFVFWLKHYGFNTYSIHPREAAENYLKYVYPQETFTFIEQKHKSYEVSYNNGSNGSEENEKWYKRILKMYYDEGKGYNHIWSLLYHDEEGREFKLYCYRGSKWRGHNGLFIENYFGIGWDTYGQLRLEELLGEKYDLEQYRNKVDPEEEQPRYGDYVVCCTEDNIDDVVDMLMDIYFAMKPISDKSGALIINIINESNEVLYDFYVSDIDDEIQQEGSVTSEEIKEIIRKKIEEKDPIYPRYYQY